MKKMIMLAALVSFSLLCFSTGFAQPNIKLWVKVEIYDPDGKRVPTVESKLARTIDKMGHIVEEDVSRYVLKGEMEVVREATSEGFDGPRKVLEVELSLSLIYLETGSNLASDVTSAKGLGKTKKEALKKAYHNFIFREASLVPLFDRALEKFLILLNEMNREIFQQGKSLYDGGDLRGALGVLSAVAEGTSSYDEAQSLIAKANAEIDRRWREKMRHEKELAYEKRMELVARADSAKAAADRAQAEADRADALARAWGDSVKYMEEKLKLTQTELEKQEIEADLEKARLHRDEVRMKLEMAQLRADSLKLVFEHNLIEADTLEQITGKPYTGTETAQKEIKDREKEMNPGGIYGKWLVRGSEDIPYDEVYMVLRKNGSFRMEMRIRGRTTVSMEGDFSLVKDQLIFRVTRSSADEFTGTHNFTYDLSGDSKLTLTDVQDMKLVFHKKTT